MGKQKGYNWKARQQGGTLDTDVVVRWVQSCSYLLNYMKENYLGALFYVVSIGGIICVDNLTNGQVKREGGRGWS